MRDTDADQEAMDAFRSALAVDAGNLDAQTQLAISESLLGACAAPRAVPR